MKRICGLLLTLALVLGLCACGQKAENAPAWQEQYDLGVKYLSEGNYQEAIIAFTAAIEIDPTQAPLYSGRGRAYVRSGETAENLAAALADFEAALELDETLAEAWLGLADVYIRMGEYDKALEVLRTGLEKTGNDPSIAGNCTRMETFGPDGALLNYDVLEYNAAGKCVKRMYFGADGSLTHYQEDEWDEQGRNTESRYYDSDGTLRNYSVTEYNEYGRSASYNYNGDGTLNSKTVYVYNEQGKQIGEERYDGAGSLTQSTVSE